MFKYHNIFPGIDRSVGLNKKEGKKRNILVKNFKKHTVVF